MIRNFAVKNYFCFKEGAEVSFVLDGNASTHLKQEVSTVLGIKGANGSGKTNIIKAISFLSMFASYSAQWSGELKSIPVFSHFNNDDETDFQIEFDVDGTIYFYELSLTDKSVLREAIYRKRGRKTLILERLNDEIVECLSDMNELKDIKLLDNASIISQYLNYKFKSQMLDLSNVSERFKNILSNVNFLSYGDLGTRFSVSKTSENYLSDLKKFEFVKDIIRKADNSISDIKIKSRENDEGEKEYYPIFIHSCSKKNKTLPFMLESSGTKTLYRTLSFYWEALMSGGLLCLDEFDVHLHAMILPDLLNLFIDKNINQNDAQFIFTAHNTEIIDTLGKYRTILVNKEDGESYCYRLDEIPGSLIRNDRTIVPLYLQGKIGGVPTRNV